MARYNKKHTIINSPNPINTLNLMNRINKVQQYREDGEPEQAATVLDKFKYVFSGDVTNVSSIVSTPVINTNKFFTGVPTLEQKELTSILERLQNEDFFQVVSNKVNSKSNAINRAIDFNNKINYTKQSVNTHASMTNVINSFNRLQEMKGIGKDQFLYIFDTETIGGKDAHKIWSPLGITEFAMQKVSLETGATEATNIVMGIAPTSDNEAIVNKILKYLQNGETEKIMQDEQLRVTAMRLSLYGDNATKLTYNKDLGYTVAEKLADADSNDWFDYDKVLRGWNRNKEAYLTSARTNYGLTQAEKTFIDSIVEMSNAAKAGNGMIAGQNFIPFDMPVVNSELQRIMKQYQDVINKGLTDKNGIGATAEQAQNALKYINEVFNNKVGFSIPTNQIFDTLPIFSAIREHYGVEALLNYDQNIIKQAAGGSARQEHIGAAWFPELFKHGDAHRADFDVTVLNNMLMTPLADRNNQTLIEYLMTGMNGQGLANIGFESHTIEANKQLFYAKNSSMNIAYAGKGQLNYTYNKKTGEVFTSSNYEIVDGKLAYNADINMGTNINKGQFYYVDSIKKIDASDLPEEVGRVLPGHSSPELFQVQMRMAVSDKHQGSGLEDLVYTFHFNSEYELSGFMSSNFGMAAYMDADNNWVINGEDAYDMLEVGRLKNGLIERQEGYRMMTPNDIIDEGVGHANEKLITDRAVRAITDSNKSYDKIKAQLEMRQFLTKAGINDLSKEELSQLLAGNPIDRLSPQISETVSNTLRKTAGFKPLGTDETKLYSNTARNIVSSWDLVGTQDPFLNKVIKNLDNYAEQNKLTKAQKQVMFTNLLESLKTNAAVQLYESSEDIRNAVTTSRQHAGSIYEYKNKYEVRVPEGFRLEQPKIKNIVSLKNIDADNDIISLDLSKANASYDLERMLVRAKYGDRVLDANPDAYKREALYQFVLSLNEDSNFKDKERITEAIKHMSEDPKNFSINYVSRSIIEEMKAVKADNPNAGLLKSLNIRALEMAPEYAELLNQTTDDTIQSLLASMNKPLDFSNKDKEAMRKNIGHYVNDNLINKYMPTVEAFEETLVGLTPEMEKQQRMLYNVLKKDISQQLTDIIYTTSRTPNGAVSIDEAGKIVFSQGDRAITFDSIPVIKLDGKTMYSQIGNQKLFVHPELVFDDNGQEIFTHNLGENFSKNRIVSRNIEEKITNGTFRMEDLLGITSYISDDIRKESVYEFKPGDYYSNYYVGTSGLDTMIPRLFGGDGDLRELGENIDLPDHVKDILYDKLKGVSVEPGELDPILTQILGPYRKNILQALAKPGSDIEYIVKNLNTGTKEKSKFGKGKMMGGNIRFETGVLNTFENLGRPPVYGSGNVYYLAAENIENVTKNALGTFYEGALFESARTNEINKRMISGVGNITTGFSSKTAYIGQKGITDLIKENYNDIINSTLLENVVKEKKDNVYNMLYATVNTFEQQKVFSARVFDQLTNGSMAANTQKLSGSKDLIGAITNESDLRKYERLWNLLGDITIDPDGIIEYKSAVGEIVKRGETIIPIAGYGGAKSNWTSKLERGVLNFSVKSQEGVKLTDAQISKILNENKEMFKGIDFSKKEEAFKVFEDIFTKQGYDTAYFVEDINKMTLPKILVNQSEKSMNHLTYAKIGSLDENVANVLRAYGKETEELIGGTVPTTQALQAYFKDADKLKSALGAGGFKSWDEFVGAINKEAFTLDDIIFGKGGILEGFTDIGNDNILGHGNKASMMIGSLGAAIGNVGKYLNGGEENETARRLGTEFFLNLYQKEENQFLRSSDGTAMKITVDKDYHMLLNDGKSINENLDTFDFIDNKRLENIFKEMDKELQKLGAPQQDRLVHNDNGTELIGSMIYNKKGEIVGSYGLGEHRIVMDPETQSSMSQNYIDAKVDLLKLKSDKAAVDSQLERLEAEYKEHGADAIDIDSYNQLKARQLELDNRINDLSEYVSNMNETGHLMRLGDQERNILKNYTIERQQLSNIEDNLASGRLTPEAVKANEAIRGVNMEKYLDTETYGFLLQDLKEQRYFNRFEERELTEGMLKQDRYAHLKDTYEKLSRFSPTGKVGLDTANLVHDIELASMANDFNNKNKFSIAEMEEKGFKVMTPAEYVNTFGDPNSATFDSMVKENVILDLDLGKDGHKYVAVPGMGSVLEEAEIKKDWHKHAGSLVSTYQRDYLELRGNDVGRDKVIEKMNKYIDAISDDTKSFITKGTEAHNLSRMQVYAATDRMKIMTTMNTVDNPLLQKAQVDGKSIANWIGEGVYYDYSFDSMEAFEKRGFFKQEYLDKMGMTREQMIEHLQTHGTVMIDDRYPNIYDTSLVPMRHYLAPNFMATNAAFIAPHSALKMNADSDGDSVSRFLVKHKNIGYSEYEITRNRIASSITDSPDLTDEARESFIRGETISAMKKAGFEDFDESIYDAFKGIDVKMSLDARNTNLDWQEKVVAKWDKDNKTVKAVQAIKQGDELLVAEVPGGKSVLGYMKLPAMSQDPNFKTVSDNMSSINNMLETIKGNKHLLDAEQYKDLFEFLDSSTDIMKSTNEAQTLDQALAAMKELADNASSGVTQETFDAKETAAIQRLRIGKYHEEAMSKLGIDATGNVNATLYGISQSTKDYYGKVGTPQFDRLKRDIVSSMAAEMEQAPISSKKLPVKAGDTRLLEFTEIFQNIKRYGLKNGDTGDDYKQQMVNWISTYMDHGKIENAYNSLVSSAGKETVEASRGDMGIVEFMATRFAEMTGEAYNAKGPMRAQVDYYSSYGRKTANAYAIQNAQGLINPDSGAGDALQMITGVAGNAKTMPIDLNNAGNQQTAQKIFAEQRKAFKEGMEHVDVGSDTTVAKAAVEKISNTAMRLSSGSGLKKGLAMGVVGLAAGLIASGYASGNPLNDANPETVAQEGGRPAPMMFGPDGQKMIPNNTSGYIINIKGDTKKGNRQLKKALKQATARTTGSTGITMNVKTSQTSGAYSDNDIENILNNYF